MKNSGWIAAAALVGFLFGVGTVLQAQVNLNAKIAESGLFTTGGHAYRLVEIKP